ncbi:MAG TPA: hypothetical protein VKU82_03440 [Planctomycetaceae bacterium]|nr:hypothetical protein [Planctomycetaceae bacterium]
MDVALSIFGVAFAASCVWLTVRIVNRRDRWAKWSLAATVGLPVLYVLGFGPACWASSRLQSSGKVVSAIYWPIIPMMWQGPPAVQEALQQYVLFGVPQGSGFALNHADIEFH